MVGEGKTNTREVLNIPSKNTGFFFLSESFLNTGETEKLRIIYAYVI